jgi:S-adenosylmethionine:tRNA ribosyltransferase-isomerase
MNPKDISIQEYSYDLDEGRIALFPLEERDQSKLLIYRKGEIKEDLFFHIHNHLPENSLLVFNDSKVINARLRFEKKTGSKIEVFCLEPAEKINDYATVMSQKKKARWKCMVGGMSKWKEPFLEMAIGHDRKTILKAVVVETIPEAYIIEFSWTPEDLSFAEILSLAGDIPLPPYIKRTTESKDTERYQTIYAKEEGSVAAPTAGLHFTHRTFADFKNKNISHVNVCLHVGAGTFKPVKASTMEGHEMHSEWIDVNTETIQSLINNTGKIIAVGTTSLRTIETLYWMGIKAYLNPNEENIGIRQWDVYDTILNELRLDASTALEALLQWLKHKKSNRIFIQTQLLITPGYRYRVASAIITNFHQPQSTLLLLVAAAIGNDWKKCYDYALENDFRFLSYGDSSLLFMAESSL